MNLYNLAVLLDYLILAIWSFFEAIFFPLPVDLAILLFVKEGNNPYLVALVATIFNTLGSFFGYKIGILIKKKTKNREIKIVKLILDLKLTKKILNEIKKYVNLLQKYSFEDKNDFLMFLYFLSTITPLPQKIFAIISGYFNLNLFFFIVLTLIGRGTRFFLVALIAESLTWKQIILLVVVLTVIYYLLHIYFKRLISKKLGK